MTGALTKFSMKESNIARLIESLHNQGGDAYLLFAYHAALPLGMTPELLYNIWANFQVDSHSKSLGIPWIAMADLLLSNLYEEVGVGLYEMDQQVRKALLEHLEQNQNLGTGRIQELARFLEAYVQPLLKSDNVDFRDFAQAQYWTSIAYLYPNQAFEELAHALGNSFLKEPDDLFRIASIVGALEKPLDNYPSLLSYARGMAKYAQGDIESAQNEFDKIPQSDSLHRLFSKGLPLPQVESKTIEIKSNRKRKNFPLLVQFLASVAIGLTTSSFVWILFPRSLETPTLITSIGSVDIPSIPPGPGSGDPDAVVPVPPGPGSGDSDAVVPVPPDSESEDSEIPPSPIPYWAIFESVSTNDVQEARDVANRIRSAHPELGNVQPFIYDGSRATPFYAIATRTNSSEEAIRLCRIAKQHQGRNGLGTAPFVWVFPEDRERASGLGQC